jgi:hypothetical protein
MYQRRRGKYSSGRDVRYTAKVPERRHEEKKPSQIFIRVLIIDSLGGKQSPSAYLPTWASSAWDS